MQVDNQGTERPDDIMTLSELAWELRLSKSWLKAQTKAGRIPSLKAGQKTIYNPDAVRRALAVLAAEKRVTVAQEQETPHAI